MPIMNFNGLKLWKPRTTHGDIIIRETNLSQNGSTLEDRSKEGEVTCDERSSDLASLGQSTDGGEARLVNTDENGSGLERGLSTGQLNMLAFAGSVGTGLIIGSGGNLHDGETILQIWRVKLPGLQ